MKVNEKDEAMTQFNAGNAAKVLFDTGLLFEINRVILHPLGFALLIEVNETGEPIGFKEELLTTDEEEGITFDKKTLLQGLDKLNKFVQEVGKERHATRRSLLGYVIQRLPNQTPNQILAEGTFEKETIDNVPVRTFSSTIVEEEGSDIEAALALSSISEVKVGERDAIDIEMLERQRIAKEKSANAKSIVGGKDEIAPPDHTKMTTDRRKCPHPKDRLQRTRLGTGGSITTCLDCGSNVSDTDLSKD